MSGRRPFTERTTAGTRTRWDRQARPSGAPTRCENDLRVCEHAVLNKPTI